MLACLGLVTMVSACGSGSSTGSSAAPSSATITSPPPQANVFASSSFLPGMRLTSPRPGWVLMDDTPIQFKLVPPEAGPGDDATALRVWLDPHATGPCASRDLHVPMSTPGRVVAWLNHNKNLEISHLRHVSIAGHFPAIQVDLDTSATAPKCDPGCPGPCMVYFLLRGGGATDTYGTGRGELVRLYIAQVGSHVLIAGLDTLNKSTFNRLTPDTVAMMGSLKLPDQLTAS